VAISEHFTVNQAETLIEAQSLIEPLNRHFWVGAVCALHGQCAPAAKQVKNCKNTNIFG
jgi:hypothetical protein